MRIESDLLGRIAVFVNIDEVVPERGIYAPDLLPAIAERYNFAFSPTLLDSIEATREKGFKFETGKLALSGGEERTIQDFTIWPDGLVVGAHTTDDAEAFLNDLSNWGKLSFGLRLNLDALLSRAYKSQLVVEFDRSLADRLSILKPICTAFNDALQRTYKSSFPPTEPITLRLDYDHAVAPAAFKILAAFVIERRENHRFDADNVFFCEAPLATQEHIKLLEGFEQSLDPESRWEGSEK